VQSLTSFVDPQTHSRHFSRTILIKVGTPSSLRTSFDSRRVSFVFLTDSSLLFIDFHAFSFHGTVRINFLKLFSELTNDFFTYDRNLVSQSGKNLVTKNHELATTFFANSNSESFEPCSPVRAPFTLCPAEWLRALDFDFPK